MRIIAAAVYCVVFTQWLVAGSGVALKGDPNACGLYFQTPEMDEPVLISSTDPREFAEALASLPRVPKNHTKFFLVGLNEEAVAANQIIEGELQIALKRAGFKETDYHSSTRLRSLIEPMRGLYYVDEVGPHKVANYNDADIERALSEMSEEELGRDYILIGSPLFFAKTPKAIARAGIHLSSVQSNARTWLKAAMHHPGRVLRHGMKRLKSTLPRLQDLQEPTKEEISRSFQKVLIPGVINFTVVMNAGSSPLEVVVPLTVVNSANSLSAAVLRSSIGNWFRRSISIPGRFVRNFYLTTFFTATLYLASRGSLESVKSALTAAGMMTFVSAKWLSVLFAVMWRAPFHHTVFEWERSRIVGGGLNEGRVRLAGATIEKHMSYLMTPFYLLSIVMDPLAWIYYDNSGIGIMPGAARLAGDQVKLMGFNVGHIAMFTVGALAIMGAKKMSLLDGVSRASLWVDHKEGLVLKTLSWPFRRSWRTLRGLWKKPIDGGQP